MLNCNKSASCYKITAIIRLVCIKHSGIIVYNNGFL